MLSTRPTPRVKSLFTPPTGVKSQAQKLEWSREFGATHLVDASREDSVARIQEICGEGGADYAIEAVGTQKTMEQAFEAIHRGGMAVMIGVAPQGTKVSVESAALLSEKILTGTGFGSARQRVHLPKIVDILLEREDKLP